MSTRSRRSTRSRNARQRSRTNSRSGSRSRRNSRARSAGRRRRGSLIPVYNRFGNVTGFRVMVPFTRADGTRTKVPRFLAKRFWPRDETALRRLGVNERFSQIVRNNVENLRRGGNKKRGSRKRNSYYKNQISPEEWQFLKANRKPLSKGQELLAEDDLKKKAEKLMDFDWIDRQSRSDVRRDWRTQKNEKLRQILKKDLKRDVTPDEFMAMPENVQREYQVMAWELSSPSNIDLEEIPAEYLSEETRFKRNTKLAKKRESRQLKAAKRAVERAERLSWARKAHPLPRDEPAGAYPGAAQAINDMLQAYWYKYNGDNEAVIRAIRNDLKTSRKVLNRNTHYHLWKRAPWDFDISGIDTDNADDSFLDALEEGGFLSSPFASAEYLASPSPFYSQSPFY